MPTNQEWLHKLANESPDELKAWFDADHVDDDGVSRSNDGVAVEFADFQSKAQSKMESNLTEQSELLSDEADSREKLEAEIRGKVAYGTSTLLYPPSANKVTQYLPSLSLGTVLGWLDRQAAITDAEWNREVDEHREAVERRANELQEQVDRLTAERDNLAADLLTCNREREQLRKHLGIALDHAHDICALVDIGD